MHRRARKTPLPRLLNPGDVIAGKWKVNQCIGVGAYGEIYSASNVNNGLSVAIKAESLFSEKKSLLAEVASLRLAQNIPFTCQYFSCGRNDTINFAIMQLLGISLSVVKKKQPDHKFLPTQAVMLIVQALECLRGLHEKDLIHRDVKPENFVFGPNKRYHVIRKQPKSQISAKEEIRLAEEDNEGTTLDILKMPLEEFKTLKREKGTDFIMSSAKKPERVVATIPHLYLIDFGLCRKRPEKEGLRMPGFRGTRRYASINAHQGKELSYRDDLWSLLFMGIELYTGKLPWDDCCPRKGVSEEDDAIAKMKKEMISSGTLVAGLPKPFTVFMNHLLTLEFPTPPDYVLCIGAFKKYYDELISKDKDKEQNKEWNFCGFTDTELVTPTLCTTERYDTKEDNTSACVIA